MNAIVVDPTTTTNGSIVAYAATVGGGVWKTTNCCSATTTWTRHDRRSAHRRDRHRHPRDRPQRPQHGLRRHRRPQLRLLLDGQPGHPQDHRRRRPWTTLGANVFGAAYAEPAGQFPQYDAVGKVRVDPNNSQNVVAGTKKGVFVSYDGGSNWSGPCAPLRDAPPGRHRPRAAEPRRHTRIIAAVGTRGFATAVQYDLGNNGANGIYAADMPASGCPSFASIASDANGFVFGTSEPSGPYAANAPMHAGSGVDYGGNASTGDQLGRIDLAIAPSDPNTIYAQAQTQIVSSARHPARHVAVERRRRLLALHDALVRQCPGSRPVRRQLQPELVRPGQSRSTRTTPTRSSSTRMTSGARPGTARASPTSRAATAAARPSTSTSTRSRSSRARRTCC